MTENGVVVKPRKEFGKGFDAIKNARKRPD
jgi:hypothetical protein